MSSSPPYLSPLSGNDQHQKPDFSSPLQSRSSKKISLSPIHGISTPSIEINGFPSPVRSCGGGGRLPFQEYEDKENAFAFEVELGEDAFHDNQKRFCSTPSPHRGLPASTDGMRHHLLVQRTFNHEVDTMSPLTTSSPMRKLMAPSGGLTPRTAKHPNKEPSSEGCHNNGATPQFKTPIRGQQLSAPDREQHAWERTPSAPRTPAGFVSPASSLYAFSTPGRQFVNPFEMNDDRVHFPDMTPGMFRVKQKEGEASSTDKEGFWTVDQRALMMPVEMKESDILRQHFYQTKRNREIEPLLQTAMDRFFANELIVPSPWSEQKVQRSTGRLAQTPTSTKTSVVAKSVSCQTVMSIPPDVDLLAEFGDKYRLPDNQLVHESPVDSSLAGSFIRRKLLHQLNENDSIVVGASPVLPSRTFCVSENVTVSTSRSPSKYDTPELEKQTPNKKSSGHFSSSPIRPSGDKGHHPAMSESDLLASPELSPIAGRGSNKPLRSSDMFTPRQELERSREIMQLDFSSILDEPDDFDNANLSEKTGTLTQSREFNPHLLQQGLSGVEGHSVQDVISASCQPRLDIDTPSAHCNPGILISDIEEATAVSTLSSHLNDNSCNIGHGSNNRSFSNTLKKSLLGSLLSAEMSTQDILPTNVPNLLSSQDTGYQTTSLQSITTQESVSNPQSQLLDIHSSSALSLSSSTNHSFMMSSSSNPTNANNAQSKTVPSASSSIAFSNSNPSNIINPYSNKDHNTLHLSFTNKFTGIMPHSENNNLRSDMIMHEEGNSLDSYLCSGARLSYLFNENDSSNDLDFYSNSFTKGHNNCRIRKIRTLADVRRLREKSNASRDLTSSFNEEAKSASTVIMRLSRSLSNPSINIDSAMSCSTTDPMASTTADMMDDDDKCNRKWSLNSQSARSNVLTDDRNINCIKDEMGTKADRLFFNANTASNGSWRGSSSSLEKRPFENIGAGALSDFDTDGALVDDCDLVQNGNKFIKLLEEGQEDGFSNYEDKDYRATLSCTDEGLKPKLGLDLNDKKTLNEARELLGKAEALRMQHDKEQGEGQLEMDTFYQYISENNDELSNFASSINPNEEAKGIITDVDKRQGINPHHQSDKREKSSCEKDKAGWTPQPVRVSTPDDDAMFDRVEEKIKSVESVKLGSEIAAEILKRAGEDLAQYTTLIDCNSVSPKSISSSSSSSHL